MPLSTHQDVIFPLNCLNLMLKGIWVCIPAKLGSVDRSLSWLCLFHPPPPSLDKMLVHTRVTTSIKDLFTWKRGTLGRWGHLLWRGNRCILTVSFFFSSFSHVHWGTPPRQLSPGRIVLQNPDKIDKAGKIVRLINRINLKFCLPHQLLGREKHCESQVSCPRTQHNVTSQGSNPDC